MSAVLSSPQKPKALGKNAAALRAIANLPNEPLPFMTALAPEYRNERAYLSMLHNIIVNGKYKPSRPGQSTLSSDEEHLVLDISDNKIPLLTTRKIFHRSFIHETIWFLSGSTDVEYLKKNDVSIWDSWVDPETARYNIDGKLTGGSIGNGAYGANWRRWADLRSVEYEQVAAMKKLGLEVVGACGHYARSGSFALMGRHVDQIADAIELLRKNPDSRRIIVSAWNPLLVPETILPACHSLFQFLSYKNEETGQRELTVKLFQRSADSVLGEAFNMAQYALLAHMVAHVTGHVATKLVVDIGDAHIYDDHLATVGEQLMRPLKPGKARLHFSDAVKEIDDFKFDDIRISGYDEGDYHPALKYPVAV